MPFPPAPRVRYRRTSLRDVVCQIRFTPVLRIEQESPATFQEAARRADFVGYERHEVASIPLISGLALPMPIRPQRIEHRFVTREKTSFIVLAQDFVAVSTSAYQGWETFKPHVELAVRSLIDAYEPAHATRVGLRYTNVIVRSDLGLEGVAWRELLAPELLGMLASHDDVDGVSQQVTFAADASLARGRLAHGLVEFDDNTGYLIDTDYWRDGEISFADAIDVLDPLHARTWDTFAACLAPRLVEAMQPMPLER
jgi:uncharacterized protein (TIGR04255 family)